MGIGNSAAGEGHSISKSREAGDSDVHVSLWQDMPLELLVADVCNVHSSLGSHVFCYISDVWPSWNLPVHKLCFAPQLFLTHLSPSLQLPSCQGHCATLVPLLAGHISRSFRQDLGKHCSPAEGPQKALHHSVHTAKTL